MKAIKDQIEAKQQLTCSTADDHYFQCLSELVDLHPATCKAIQGINLRLLLPLQPRQAYRAHAILNEVILLADLKSISLSNFTGPGVIAALATLSDKEGVVEVALPFNGLTITHFILLLDTLPAKSKSGINLDVSNNCIANEQRAALHLFERPNLKSLCISTQTPSFDIAVLKAELGKKIMSLDLS